MALAAAFGVEPSYLVDRKEPPPLDAELLEGLRDETTREITREALRLPAREREIVLGIVRQFEAMSVTPRSRLASSTPFVSGARRKRLYSTWFEASDTP